MSWKLLGKYQFDQFGANDLSANGHDLELAGGAEIDAGGLVLDGSGAHGVIPIPANEYPELRVDIRFIADGPLNTMRGEFLFALIGAKGSFMVSVGRNQVIYRQEQRVKVTVPPTALSVVGGQEYALTMVMQHTGFDAWLDGDGWGWPGYGPLPVATEDKIYVGLFPEGVSPELLDTPPRATVRPPSIADAVPGYVHPTPDPLLMKYWHKPFKGTIRSLSLSRFERLGTKDVWSRAGMRDRGAFRRRTAEVLKDPDAVRHVSNFIFDRYLGVSPLSTACGGGCDERLRADPADFAASRLAIREGFRTQQVTADFERAVKTCVEAIFFNRSRREAHALARAFLDRGAPRSLVEYWEAVLPDFPAHKVLIDALRARSEAALVRLTDGSDAEKRGAKR